LARLDNPFATIAAKVRLLPSDGQKICSRIV
jgi:hypothetical protein